MHRNLSLASTTLVLLSLTIAVLAFGRKPQGEQAKVVTVEIRDYKFVPETVTVHQGDTVEWKNDDKVVHTATAEGQDQKPAFDSGSIATGATWRYVAGTKGKFNYRCTVHPYMKGELTVQ
jgi:plastocyanin